MSIEPLIRAAEARDAEALTAVHNCPLVQRNTLQLPFTTVEVWRKRLADQTSSVILLVAEVEGQIVGDIGLHMNRTNPRKMHVAGLGMSVHDGWQGKGIGTALMAAAMDMADKWLQVIRVELTVYTDNAPAIALYRKFGFEQEGLLRKYAYRDGAHVDAYQMARVR